MSYEEKLAAALEQERQAARDEAVGMKDKARLRREYAATLRELAWEMAEQASLAEPMTAAELRHLMLPASAVKFDAGICQ